jgi:O-antigen biosynthesis protein
MGIFKKLKTNVSRIIKIKSLERLYTPKRVKQINNDEKEVLDFKSEAPPLVSIIIPFHNQINYTKNCLHHLNIHLNNTIAYEIILVDDNSTENFDYGLIKGIKVIRNNLNVGFLKSINIGIKEAVGEFIYILNNDTEVQDRFLKELLNVFYTFPNVGAVGSKLINADGSLQEAGSVFLKNCSIHNIAGNRKVYYPQVNYIYKVDYCSGCSLLFKKYNDNGEINLFDEQFAPAYFEETDLCFQLKYLQNKDIYYCPFSEVLHYNGVTYNNPKNDLSTKALQKEALFKTNLARFKNKWQKQIDAIKAKTIEERIAEIYENKSIVFFVGAIPAHDKDSGSNRLKEIIQAYLQLGYLVSIVKNKTFFDKNEYISYYQKQGVNVFYEHKIKIKLEQYVENNFSKASIAWFYNSEVFFEYYTIAEKYLPQAKLVYDMVDIHHLRFKRALELEPLNKIYEREYKKLKQLESFAANKADYVLTISDLDQNYMTQFCDRSKIITLSNVHYLKTTLDKTLSFEQRNDILFIGSSHAPNIDALYFLYNEVMPLVWKIIPDLKVNIIGNVKDWINDIDNPNFLFRGFVPDIESYFSSNKLMIAPLRYGAGVKGKIGQAFEYFLPVVTTSIGAEGMQLINGDNALINDDAVGLANSIIELYSNKNIWLKLQGNSEKSLFPFSKEKLKMQISKIV